MCQDVQLTNVAAKQKCAAVLTDDLTCTDIFSFEMHVENVGKIDGTEVVLVYSKPPLIAGTHIKQVVGFQRVFVKAGQSAKVNFALNVCSTFRIVDTVGKSLIPAGEHSIIVGDGPLSFPVQVHLHN